MLLIGAIRVSKFFKKCLEYKLAASVNIHNHDFFKYTHYILEINFGLIPITRYFLEIRFLKLNSFYRIRILQKYFIINTLYVSKKYFCSSKLRTRDCVLGFKRLESKLTINNLLFYSNFFFLNTESMSYWVLVSAVWG